MLPDGRCAGLLLLGEDGRILLRKTRVDPRRHLLRALSAYAVGLKALTDLRELDPAGIVELVLTDGRRLTASLGVFDDRGVVVCHTGYEEQLALPIEHWCDVTGDLRDAPGGSETVGYPGAVASGAFIRYHSPATLPWAGSWVFHDCHRGTPMSAGARTVPLAAIYHLRRVAGWGAITTLLRDGTRLVAPLAAFGAIVAGPGGGAVTLPAGGWRLHAWNGDVLEPADGGHGLH
jgi:hypothetical protein